MGVVIDRTNDDLDAVERQICNVAYPQKKGSSGLPGNTIHRSPASRYVANGCGRAGEVILITSATGTSTTSWPNANR